MPEKAGLTLSEQPQTSGLIGRDAIRSAMHVTAQVNPAGHSCDQTSASVLYDTSASTLCTCAVHTSGVMEMSWPM